MGSVLELKLRQKRVVALNNAPIPRQLELFRNRADFIGMVCLVDYSAIDRDILVNIIAKNEVGAILDFRKRKSFSPNTDIHRIIADYIVNRRVFYADLFLKNEMYGNSCLDYMADILSECFVHGLTILLTNREDANVDTGALRYMMARHPAFRAEVSPRSI